LTLTAKQRLVVAALAVLAVWPLAHRALVVRYDLDPWRFFGWAMYCTPKLPADIHLFTVEHGVRVPVELGSLTPAQRRSVHALQLRRSIWGSLATPERVGSAILAAKPDADIVEVVVSKWYLDPATAHIATRDERYRFKRIPPDP
jgi:hypothetical protein